MTAYMDAFVNSARHWWSVRNNPAYAADSLANLEYFSRALIPVLETNVSSFNRFKSRILALYALLESVRKGNLEAYEKAHSETQLLTQLIHQWHARLCEETGASQKHFETVVSIESSLYSLLNDFAKVNNFVVNVKVAEEQFIDAQKEYGDYNGESPVLAKKFEKKFFDARATRDYARSKCLSKLRKFSESLNKDFLEVRLQEVLLIFENVFTSLNVLSEITHKSTYDEKTIFLNINLVYTALREHHFLLKNS